MSLGQERLWFLDRFDPGNPAFHLSTALQLTGPLDPRALERGLHEVMRRHDVLRMRVVARAGQPVAEVAPRPEGAMARHDLTGLSATARRAEVPRLAVAWARQALDLERGPLLRAVLLRLAEAEHVLLLTAHRLIADADSWEPLCRELFELYRALAAGRPFAAGRPAIRYAEFARRQRQWLQGEEGARQLAYWKDRLAGAPAVMELPTDHPRGAVVTYRGTRRSRARPPALSAALRAFCGRQGVPLPTLLLAAFKVLLWRITGQEDVIVGSLPADRDREDMVIGPLVNPLVLRTHLAADGSFRQLLERMVTTLREAGEHRDLPFERLVEELQPQRDMSHHPLFQVMFVFRETPASLPELPDLVLRPLEIDDGIARWDLTLELGISTATLECNTDLFDPTTAERLLAQFERLLAGIAEDPDRPLRQLPWLPQAHRHQLLAEWNDARAPYPREATIHELFEQQAAATPEAVALVFADASLSYGELNRRANQLGRQLRALGVRPEVPVGIHLERSPQMVTATLAVLKAGGFYVPLDPSYPRERVRFMLEDGGIPILVTREGLAAELSIPSVRMLCLDSAAWSSRAANSQEPPLAGTTVENLAYVLYTSGSTGRPKGVGCNHAGVINLLADFTARAPLRAGDACSWWTSSSFDVSVYEIFSALVAGATLHIVPDEVRADGERFVAWLGVQGIRSAYVAPSMLQELAARLHRQPRDLCLRRLLVGVEPIPEALLAAIAEGIAGIRVINGYGPTEATICATLYNVRGPAPSAARNTPIGRPTRNAEIYLLDRDFRPAPIGVAGELSIGGDGLARGYHQRPQLTAERFVPNPFCEQAGERLYRTGDLVRALPQGDLVFLGRRDDQVKVRGFRIELAEVEAHLGRHPGVRECAVVARDPGAGGKRLVAFVVAREAPAPAPAVLRGFLRESLPEYMVPAAFVPLDALPLTPNGKVDRRALGRRAPEETLGGPAEDFVAPRTPTEEVLAGLWSQLLGQPSFGIHDSFFDLGGHSLLATQLVSRVRDLLKVELPLQAFFETATVGALAAHLDRARCRELTELPLVPVPRDRRLPLSFAQQRLWFLDRYQPHSPVYNLFFGYRLSGPLEPAALERGLHEIVRRHEVLRARLVEVDAQPCQEISAPPPRFPLPVVELAALAPAAREAELRRLAHEQARRPFRLAEEAPLRAALLRLGPAEHLFLLSIHHVAADGWSMGIFNRELELLYGACTAGRPASALPELPIQYPDFAVWQRRWLEREEVWERQLTYWKAHLRGMPDSLELPGDRPRPPIQSGSGARFPVAVDRELTASLELLGRRWGATLFMVLLAAFRTLLQRTTGQQDMAVGSAIANRNRSEIEELIGFFVNTLLLRIDLTSGPPPPELSFPELLRRVREVTLGAYAHQDLPFEKLVEELQPQRDLSRQPLFQVMFVLQNTPGPLLRLPGLTARPLAVDNGTAKFDLTLSLDEDETGLGGFLEYDTELFDRTTMARFGAHFELLLAAIAEDPEKPLEQLPWLAAAERHQLLAAWNDTAIAPPALLFHERVERQAERTPDAVAVVFEGRRWSYRELDHRANQLAHFLRGRGVGGPASRAEALVGLCVERSPELVVGVLGILKAGGAWLPLDPEYPRERLAFMIADTRLPVILTQKRLLDALPEHQARVVCLDSEWDAVAAESTARPAGGAAAEHLAYVIYTSGSTGRPKGVAVSHRGLSNLAAAQRRLFDLPPAARILQFSSLSFDASVWEITMALAVGAALHLAPRERLLPGSPLAELLREQRITCITLPPSALAVLGAPELPALTTLVVAGEASSPELARPWSAGRRFWNAYGPTETTVCATAGRYGGGPRLPIGTPIANTRVHLLDRHLKIVPVGVVGELRIGGTGLARGYLHRPELTAERFLPDPFAEGGDAGARLYRTGDLARYLADGTIEFLGRIDHQVKLRGFRIELGEIEAVLSRHPAVREAAVLVREDPPSERRLVACVVAEGECLPTAHELRGFLQDRLPEYMVPAVFAVLDSLPLTPAGKVDRGALGRRALPRSHEPEAGMAALENPLEELLAGIWMEVLGPTASRRVGVHDSFFELGGHSLLVTQMISRVRDLLGVDLPVRRVFRTPTVAGLAEAIDRARRVGRGRVAPVPRDRRLPLSFGQQRLWFLDRFQPQSAVYNLHHALRLDGPLDRRALAYCLGEIVRRHEVLRTRLVEVDGEPCQVISAPQPVPLPVVELATLAPAARAAELERLAREHARQPFRLAEGPLLRAALLAPGPEEHVFLVNIHHVAADGWSMGIFHRELELLYEAHCADRTASAPLPELAIQYADFAVWQRRWLAGEEVGESQLSYWKTRLRGMPDALELPWDRPRPPLRSYRGAKHPLAFGRELAEDLELIGRRRGATLYMVLLAAFQALLQRITGQKDMSVGSAIANRNRSEIEALIGFFVNTLLLRIDLTGDPDPSFRELLDRVREVTLGALAHQDLPFEKLVEELQPQRDLSRQPLFEVMFVLQNTPGSGLRLPGLTASPLAVDNGTAKFDLTLSLDADGTGLSGFLEYDTERFDRTTIRRLAESLGTLIRSVVAAPEQRLSALSLLTPAGERQLLLEWNDTAAPYPREATIHELFEQQAAAAPEAVALAAGDSEQVSYRELNRRANRLAHALRRRGVGAESCVGLCAERSVAMVVGILGILKAGGAYVPLDPSYPSERLALMVEDACSAAGRPPLLVAHQRLAERLPGLCRIDLDGTELAPFSAENPSSGATAEGLAYVMYTSGSTGRPKGVSVVHRGVVRLVRGANYAAFDDRQVLLQFAPISFDASTLEIWGALLGGGRLVIFPPHAPSLQELGAVVARYRVTTLWLTAGLFHQVVDEGPAGLQAVRQLLAGGDVLSAGHVRRALEALPGCTLINGYGPTESTTFTCCAPMRAAGEVEDSVSIGRPISNTRVYVLDRQLRPVPAGVFGELSIGGDGLARGYLGRPERTAASLVPAPRGEFPGGRLYRTGDVVRFLADGRIEFLGRRDDQVKVRGFRIELAEVEAHLGRHPGVRECAVVAEDPGAGGKRLVAFVVAREEPAPAPAVLRGFLRESLPDYMVPAAFVPLDALPLTPNGKVDRRALGRRAPAEASCGPEADFVAPRTPIEEMLVGLWSQLLGPSRIGIHDNFFELGGHSLLATQLISRIRDLYGVELPLGSVFQTPTPAGLTERIETARRGGRDRTAAPIRPVSRDRELPLSFSQLRQWFLVQLEPGTDAYNIPVALRFTGPLRTAALHCALREIVRRHESLRTTFTAAAGKPIQVVAPSLDPPLPLVDLGALSEPQRRDEVRRIIRAENHHSFDLGRGPLLRYLLLRVAAQEHILLVTMHHIISDGWSLGIFSREMATLYEAFARARPWPLPELSIQYADFASWQQHWLQGEVLEEHLAYWRSQLAAASAVLELPTDRPRPPLQTYASAIESVGLSARLSKELRTLAQQQGVTPFILFLAAFKVLLHRISHQDSISVGTFVANRRWREIEPLIGFFVNTLVLHTEVAGTDRDPSFRELLARVRETTLGAYEHQDLPFEKLLEELDPERDMSRSPLFQAMLVFQNFPVPDLELEDLEIRPLPLTEDARAHFDLTLWMWEEGEDLLGLLQFNPDLFDRTTAARLMSQFRVLLAALSADPTRPLPELALLDAAQRQQLLLEWSGTDDGRAQERCIHALFEARAAQTPEAWAVVDEGIELTYRELNARANQLAHFLRRRGVAPEEVVAICLERSAQLMVAVLGVLKAGGAYLALDPTYPPRRLAFMLEDTAAPVLLTRRTLVDTLPDHGARIFCLDAEAETILRRSVENPRGGAHGGQLAYVVYTSGSLGQPKGVMIPHAGLVGSFLAWEEEYRLRQWRGCHLQMASPSFDVFSGDWTRALCSGGQLVLCPRDSLLVPERLDGLMRRRQVDCAEFVPAVLRGLVSYLEQTGRSLDFMRLLAVGSDAWHVSEYQTVKRFCGPRTRLVNSYGVAEAAIDSTCFERIGVPLSPEKTVPIGRPFAGNRVYLLDRDLRPVPCGVFAELVIGGPTLARGYLARPAMTAERFLPDPFSHEPGLRLYRTGDLARYLPDGNLEFLGRIDHQVKIRGFRIELGEIEAELGTHPAVREAAVIVREDRPRDKRLYGYVVPEPGGEPTAGELRRFLKEGLPEYMVPAAILILEAMPLTPNGKVDHRALPAPGPAQLAADESFVAPETPTEELLAEIWGELLEIGRVGVSDHFFDLGGHSLLVPQLISRLQDTFQVDLPVRVIFEAPNIAEMAVVIEEVLLARIEELSEEEVEQLVS